MRKLLKLEKYFHMAKIFLFKKQNTGERGEENMEQLRIQIIYPEDAERAKQWQSVNLEQNRGNI